MMESKKPQTFRIMFHVATPMFAGGATPGSLKITARALKNVVRFWWRALNYAKFCGSYDGFKRLQGEEARLFGVAAEENAKIGQSPLLWRVSLQGTASHFGVGHKFGSAENGPGERRGCGGFAYLAGMGLVRPRNQTVTSARPFYAGGFEIVLELTPRLVRGGEGAERTLTPLLNVADIGSILDALKAFGLLGGLGARSRRGFGSISLISMEEAGNFNWQVPTNEEAYIGVVRDLLARYGSNRAEGLPPYSAFCAATRIVVAERSDSAEAVLESIGRKMQQYRGWGRNNKLTTGEQAQKKFKDDHDWAKKPEDFEKNLHARRIAFGLPHNYTNCDVKSIAADHFERRASPLVVHIHRLGESRYIGVLTVFAARFLPEGERLWVKRSGTSWQPPRPGEKDNRDLRPVMTKKLDGTDYDVHTELEAFIDGRHYDPANEKVGDEYFPGREAVWPIREIVP